MDIDKLLNNDTVELNMENNILANAASNYIGAFNDLSSLFKEVIFRGPDYVLVGGNIDLLVNAEIYELSRDICDTLFYTCAILSGVEEEIEEGLSYFVNELALSVDVMASRVVQLKKDLSSITEEQGVSFMMEAEDVRVLASLWALSRYVYRELDLKYGNTSSKYLN